MVMPTIHWEQWVTEPVVLAVIALIGVLVGHLTTGWVKHEDKELGVLSLTVDTLMKRVDDLQEEVSGLRAEVREAEKNRRLAWEKYSASVAYIRILLLRLTSAGQTITAQGLPWPPVPDPPDIVAVDMGVPELTSAP